MQRSGCEGSALLRLTRMGAAATPGSRGRDELAIDIAVRWRAA
jgi:hypothetical protein